MNDCFFYISLDVTQIEKEDIFWQRKGKHPFLEKVKQGLEYLSKIDFDHFSREATPTKLYAAQLVHFGRDCPESLLSELTLV